MSQEGGRMMAYGITYTDERDARAMRICGVSMMRLVGIVNIVASGAEILGRLRLERILV